MDEENGVWRTISGRRIFIKEGQSLSDAMKESGKYEKETVEQFKDIPAKSQLTPRQSETFEFGKTAKEWLENEYGDTDDWGMRAIMQKLMHSGEFDNELETMEVARYGEALFHSGWIGREPEYRTGYRYGDIPESGYSMNWAEGTREEGVSLISFEDSKSIYDVTLGYQGFKKIKVGGLYIGGSGSDGEPLLLNAVKLSDKKK